MTPRKTVRTDPITWETIDLAIQIYDRDYIQPRQDKHHAENVGRLELITTRVQAIESFFNEWKRPAKIFAWFVSICVSAILLGVIALVFDFVKWGINAHWKW
jgi:hypothetical protein